MDIIPELGAMVYQIGLIDNSGVICNILESDSSEELLTNPWFRGRILFPFNDRIPEGKYSYNDKEYQLPINSEEDGSSIHGLVYDKSFSEMRVDLRGDSGEIVFAYSIDKDDYESFPFSVDLEVSYKISHYDFSVSYIIRNNDDKTLPVALGWHPYFSFNQKVDSLKLKGGGGEYVAVDETLNPTGEILPVKGSSIDFTDSTVIGKQELDIAFTSSENGKILLDNDKNLLEIYFDPEFFHYVQFFIPPDRKSIAIEPITAATNSFNINGLGKIELQSGEERSGSVKISLNQIL